MPDTQPTPTPSQPDLSAMDQPGPSTMESVAPPNLTQGNLPAYGEPGAAEQPSTVVPAGAPAAQPAAPPKHAGLLAMVQGLADGLAGFSAGVASKGKVSGAEVVQNLEGQRAEQQQKKVAATQAQRDAELRNKLTTAETNEVMSKTHALNATLQDEMSLKHTQAQESGLGLQQKAQEIFDTTGRIPTGWSADPSTGQVTQGKPSASATGAAPAGGPSATPSMYDRRASIILDAVGKELADPNGKEDPSVTAARAVFANPASTIEQKQQTLVSLQQRAGMNAQVVKNLTEKADLAAKQQTIKKDELAAGQARVADATWRRSVPKDANGNPTMDFATWQKGQEKALEQSITQGDPEIGGKMLADGTATLAELKARGSTPELIEKEILAAKKIDPKYNASDEIVGEQALKNASTQTFFGSARSLVQSGGMLDQLKQAHDRLGNTKVPVFNKYADWLSYQAGTPELSAYRAAVLGAADDYAKVVGGGNPTDSARQASADQFIYQLNNKQFDQSVETSRGAVRSQVEGRIGTNRYVRQREADILDRAGENPVEATHPAPPKSPASKVHANMGDFTHQFAGKSGTIFSDDGKTWYDTHGQLVK